MSDVYVVLSALLYLTVVTVLSRHRLRELLPQRFFGDTWRDADRCAARALAARSETTTAIDWRPLTTFVVASLVLTGQKYLGDPALLRAWIPVRGVEALAAGARGAAVVPAASTGAGAWLSHPYWMQLVNITYWDACQVVGFLVVPAVVIWLRRERLRDYGLQVRGFLHHAWIYAFMLGVVIPVVWVASGRQAFLDYYPIYRQAGRSWFDFGFWESVYALQFLAVEFFFRGFLVLGLEDRLGSAAIAAAVVPYCMIHFGKPLPEVCAAIVAGIILGTLALKTRSILAGAMIHVTVAISMDVSALLRSGGLPH
jgi:hypothetical protein